MIDKNEINVSMFSYEKKTNLFFSRGKIEILDKMKNKYFLSEIYIDEKAKKIAGSDMKVF